MQLDRVYMLNINKTGQSNSFKMRKLAFGGEKTLIFSLFFLCLAVISSEWLADRCIMYIVWSTGGNMHAGPLIVRVDLHGALHVIIQKLQNLKVIFFFSFFIYSYLFLWYFTWHALKNFLKIIIIKCIP